MFTLHLSQMRVDVSIANHGGIDADRADFVRHFAVRVLPHVCHHRADRLAYPADLDECERALLLLSSMYCSRVTFDNVKDTSRCAFPLAISRPLDFGPRRGRVEPAKRLAVAERTLWCFITVGNLWLRISQGAGMIPQELVAECIAHAPQRR
jgi:hypothetical protein